MDDMDDMNTTPRTLRIAVVGSLLALVLLVADSVTIAVDGGSGESSLEFALFIASLLVLHVSLVALGLHWTAGRAGHVRAATCLGLLVGAGLLVLTVQLVVGAVQPDDPGWAWGEVNLWVVGTLTCALAAWSARRHSARGSLLPAVPGHTRGW